MEQGQFTFREPTKNLSDEIVLKQPEFKAALKLCKEISGLTDDQICRELEVDPAQWSRIWSGKGHFPDNLINRYMQLCENDVPLRWLSITNGYALVRLKSRLEEENETLKAALAEKDKEIEILVKYKERGLI